MRNRALIVLLLSAVATACNRPEPGTLEYLAQADDDCVVAEGAGVLVVKRDVDELRQHRVPPPPLPEAARWALDIALAEWKNGDVAEKTKVAERVRRYRGYFLVLEREAAAEGVPVAELFERLRAEARVSTGPCYVRSQS